MKFRFPAPKALAGFVGALLGMGIVAHAQSLPATDAPGSAVSPQQLSQNWTWANKPAANAGNDNAYATVTDAAGNVYVAGSYTDYITAPGGSLQISHGGTDGYLIKYTYGGTKVWAKRMGGLGNDAIKGLAVDDQGRIYAVGYIDGAGDASPINLPGTSGNTNVFVACYNSSGTALWAKSIGGTGTDIGTDIAVDGGYRVYVSGNYEADIDFGGGSVMAHTGSSDAFLIALNASGEHRWHASVASAGRDNGAAVALGSGHVFFGGTLAGQATYQQQTVTPSGTTDGFLARLDTADGASAPLALMGGAGRDAISGLDCFGDEAYLYASGQMSTGSINFGSSTLSTTYAKAALVLRYSGTTPVWGRTIDALSYGVAVATGPDTSAYVVGLYQGVGNFGPTSQILSNGQADLFTVNYDRTGTYEGVATAGGTYADTVTSVYADRFGAVYVAGNTNFTISFGTIQLVVTGSGTECYLAKLNDPCMVATPVLTTNSPVCVPQSIVLRGSNISPGTIVTIIAPNGTSYTGSTQSISALSVQQGGVYTLKVASAVQNCIRYATANVVVNPQPNNPTAAGTTLCGQGSVTLNASNIPSGCTVEWYDVGTGSAALATGPSFTTPVLTSTTTYYVKARSAEGCLSTGSPVTVTISGNGTPPTIRVNGPTTFCQGNSLTLNAQGGGTYTWSTGTVGTTITVRNSGTYTVSSTVNGCSLTSAPVVVTVKPLPPSPTVTSDTLCGAGSMTLTASGGQAGDTYVWWADATGGTALNYGASYITPSLSFTRTYYVDITRDGCSSATRTLTRAVISSNPTVNMTASGATSICQGGSVRFNATGSATRWQFYRNGQPIPGATGRSYLATDSGLYSVYGSNSGCTVQSVSLRVTINPSASAAFRYADSLACTSGGGTLSPQITGTGGGFFSAIPSGMSIDANTGQINLAASQLGTYTVRYMVGSTCGDTGTHVISLIAPPTTGFRYPVDAGCAGATAPVQVQLAPGASAGVYSASPAGLTISTGTGTIDLTSSQPGTYTVQNTIAASATCPAAVSSASFTVNAVPTTPTINSQTQGNGILLTSSAAAGNQWFLNGNPVPGATGQTLLVNDPANNGTYTVQVTANGCTSAFSAGSAVTITGIADGLGNLKLTLAPNPTTNGRTQLKLTGARVGETVQILVLDALGRVVYTATPVAEGTETIQELNLSMLPKGLYTVRVFTTDRVLTQALVRD